MANNKTNKTATSKAAKTNAKSPKQANTPKPKKQVPPVETAQVEESAPVTITDATPKNIVGSTRSKLDANRRVDLLGLATKFFHDDPDAKSKYGNDVVDAMDKVVACGIVSALADEAVYGDSTFSTVLKTTQYPMLVVAAHDMGITLPNINALPAGTENNTVVLNSNAVEVSKETKEAMAEEHEIEKKGDNKEIELDPEKVAKLGEDALVAALRYHMISGPKKSSPFTMLTSVVDFMKKYRNALAELAENTDAAKAEYNDRTMYDWLMDAFNIVPPTVLFKGIGGGMRDLVIKEKSPLSAFLILRNALVDKETNEPVWEDEDIAYATRAIIEFIVNNEIKCDKALITTLVKDDENYEKELNRLNGNIAVNEEVLKNVSDISFEIVENFDSEDKAALSARGRVWKAYYPECDAAEMPRYKNLVANLAQRAGVILNLFRAPGNKNQNFSEANIAPVEKYTIEEYMEIQKKQKEQATAAKKEETKKD